MCVCMIMYSICRKRGHHTSLERHAFCFINTNESTSLISLYNLLTISVPGDGFLNVPDDIF